jgi:rubrerythrin
MKKWKCNRCGYASVAEEPPAKCPICFLTKFKEAQDKVFKTIRD